ncbi:MAG: GNAT family N-acetyltransferase [Bacteroidota bacterium]
MEKTHVITIRVYEPKDKEEVIDLIRLNTPDYFAVQEEQDFSNYLETERELFYVLLLDRKIAGCGGINFSDKRTTGILSWDIIHPAHQGKSLGTTLMKHRMDQLRSLGGIQKITVRTSQVAYRFYEKQGFELLEIVKDYWAEGFDLYNMACKWP